MCRYVCWVYAWQLLSNPTGPWELKSTRLHLRVTQPVSASVCGLCLTGQWSMCVSTCMYLCLRVCVWVVSRKPNGLVVTVRMCLCRSVGVMSEFRFVCCPRWVGQFRPRRYCHLLEAVSFVPRCTAHTLTTCPRLNWPLTGPHFCWCRYQAELC